MARLQGQRVVQQQGRSIAQVYCLALGVLITQQEASSSSGLTSSSYFAAVANVRPHPRGSPCVCDLHRALWKWVALAQGFHLGKQKAEGRASLRSQGSNLEAGPRTQLSSPGRFKTFKVCFARPRYAQVIVGQVIFHKVRKLLGRRAVSPSEHQRRKLPLLYLLG